MFQNAKTNLMSWLAETMQDAKASVKSENVEDTPVGARLDPGSYSMPYFIYRIFNIFIT